MARYTVVEDTSETLLGILGAAVHRAFPAPATRPTVQLAAAESFDDLPPAAPTPPVLTVWLYRIAPDGGRAGGVVRLVVGVSRGR